jgi:hypothetical protein
MKFKPKDIQVNLPVVLTFDDEDEIVEMAAAFNTFVHGKVKMKYETLGQLDGRYVGLFYIQRNKESQQLREEFEAMIEAEEVQKAQSKKIVAKPITELVDSCSECGYNNILCICYNYPHRNRE